MRSSQPRYIRRLINYFIADRSRIGIKIGAKAFCPSQGWNRSMQHDAYHSSSINKRRFRTPQGLSTANAGISVPLFVILKWYVIIIFTNDHF